MHQLVLSTWDDLGQLNHCHLANGPCRTVDRSLMFWWTTHILKWQLRTIASERGEGEHERTLECYNMDNTHLSVGQTAFIRADSQ